MEVRAKALLSDETAHPDRANCGVSAYVGGSLRLFKLP